MPAKAKEKTKPAPKNAAIRRKNAEGKKMFLMILSFLILTFLFAYFPLHGWIYALYDYRAPLKLSQCDFAVFLNEIKCKWFKNLVQILMTLPNFISWTLVYAVAFNLFSTTGMSNNYRISSKTKRKYLKNANILARRKKKRIKILRVPNEVKKETDEFTYGVRDGLNERNGRKDLIKEADNLTYKQKETDRNT